jgi:[ribosomal protein S18]-alanine N-acetyltransferase
MLIRSATAEDIPAILAIAGKAEHAAHWPEEQYRGMFEGQTPRHLVLVIEERGTVQGFVIGHLLDQECEIENLVVASDFRRRGWGSKLLRSLIDAAHQAGATAFFLEVRESNLAARALYNRTGFVENGRRKRYYREPEEDAIVLTFRLPSADNPQ